VITRVDVDILELDVLALDSKDRPVPDLKKEDFEVRIAGKVQPLEYFDPPSTRPATGGDLTAAPAPAPAVLAGTTTPAQPDQRPAPHLLVFVDLEDLPLGAVRDAIPAVSGALSRVPPPVRFSVASHFGRTSPSVWEEESRDRVTAALETMAEDAAEEARQVTSVSDGMNRGGNVYAAGARTYEAREQMERQLLDSLVSALEIYRSTRDGRPLAEAWRQIGLYVQAERLRVRELVAGLRRVCEDFARLDGRKVLVFVSRGFERYPGFNFLQAAQIAQQSTVRGGAPPAPGTTQTLPGMPGMGGGGITATLLTDYDDLVKWLGGTGITLHFLDPSRGTDLPTAAQGRSERYRPLSNERFNLQDSGANLASATGGLSSFQAGDLPRALATFLDASAGAYRLGVRMTDVDPRRTYKVDVRVLKSGIRALARSSYQPKLPGASAVAAVAEADRQRLRATADEKRPGAARLAGKTIDVAIEWRGKSHAPAVDGKNLYKLEVKIAVDDLKFLAEDDGLVASTRISVVADSAEGKGRETFTEDLFLAMTGKEYSAASGTQTSKTLTLVLAPGRWSLSVSVSDLLENRTGIARATVVAEP
jgi:VWFA-related protein